MSGGLRKNIISGNALTPRSKTKSWFLKDHDVFLVLHMAYGQDDHEGTVLYIGMVVVTLVLNDRGKLHDVYYRR